MNLNFLNNKSAKQNIKSNLWLVTLLLVIVGISFSCKKYTKEEEQYRITVESNVPLKEVSYVITKPYKGRFVGVDAFASVLSDGFLKPLNDYEYVLDTSLITDKIHSIGIRHPFDALSGDSVDPVVNATMIRTKTNEVLFEKSFHEDYEIGSFRINL